MKRSVALLGFAVLAGCGGGDGGSSNSTVENGIVESPPLEVWAPDATHLEVVKANYAHDRSITGSGVTVAVFDSGIDEAHIEFAGKRLNSNSASYVSAIQYYTLDELEARGYQGGLDSYDPIEAGEQADEDGHGTHVAAMIWGEDVGIAPGVDLLMMDTQTGRYPRRSSCEGLNCIIG